MQSSLNWIEKFQIFRCLTTYLNNNRFRKLQVLFNIYQWFRR